MRDSQPSANTPDWLRRRRPGGKGRPGTSGSSQQPAQPAPRPEHYSRVGAKLARVVNVILQDLGKDLPAVSINELERSLDQFLEEIRLGLPAGESSSTRTAQGTAGRYGRKLSAEVKDPELAARVRKNRASVRKDIDRKYLERGGS